MAKASLITQYEEMLKYLRKHAERFEQFHRPPEEVDGDGVPGHYHFGLEDISYPEIQEKFKREECFKEAMKGVEEEGDLYFKNFVLQNDILAAVERAVLENNRTRIRNIVYSADIRKGHSYPKGLLKRFVDQALQTPNVGGEG